MKKQKNVAHALVGQIVVISILFQENNNRLGTSWQKDLASSLDEIRQFRYMCSLLEAVSSRFSSLVSKALRQNGMLFIYVNDFFNFST